MAHRFEAIEATQVGVFVKMLQAAGFGKEEFERYFADNKPAIMRYLTREIALENRFTQDFPILADSKERKVLKNIVFPIKTDWREIERLKNDRYQEVGKLIDLECLSIKPFGDNEAILLPTDFTFDAEEFQTKVANMKLRYGDVYEVTAFDISFFRISPKQAIFAPGTSLAPDKGFSKKRVAVSYIDDKGRGVLDFSQPYQGIHMKLCQNECFVLAFRN